MQKNIFDEDVYAEVLARLDALTPNTQRLWGKMNVAQMLAHLAAPLQTGLNEVKAKSVYLPVISPLFVKYLIRGGSFAKGATPTMKEFKANGNYDFEKEKKALHSVLQRFITVAKSNNLYKHPFFGNMSTTEWGILTYSHFDHHLRQFGV